MHCEPGGWGLRLQGGPGCRLAVLSPLTSDLARHVRKMCEMCS